MASLHVAGAAAVPFSAKPSTIAAGQRGADDAGDPLTGGVAKTVPGRRLTSSSALTALTTG